MRRLPALILLAACAREAAPATFDITLPAPETVVPLESELLGRANGMTVDEEGTLWIADGPSRRVLVVPIEGEAWMFGTEGEGPGEFGEPNDIVVRAGVVQVLDRGTARLQEYDRSGASVSDTPVRIPLYGYSSLGRGRRIAASTFGADSALAVLARSEGEPVPLGPVVVATEPFLDMNAAKAQIARGEVPDIFRNTAVPFPGERGVYLALHSEREVRRYDDAGTLLWTTRLDGAEVDAAFAAFFRANAANDGPGIAGLAVVSDAEEVGDELWLLMRGEEGRPSIVRVLDAATGEERGRLALTVPAPATRLAVDPDRTRLYLALGDLATVVATDLSAVPRSN